VLKVISYVFSLIFLPETCHSNFILSGESCAFEINEKNNPAVRTVVILKAVFIRRFLKKMPRYWYPAGKPVGWLAFI
jgi:hypothetical protein